MKVNVYLKVYCLRSFIPPFIDWDIQFVKGECASLLGFLVIF